MRYYIKMLQFFSALVMVFAGITISGASFAIGALTHGAFEILWKTRGVKSAALPSSVPPVWREVRFPSSVLLPVPFTVQAPENDWSQPWQDFCEEASIVMAEGYRDKIKEIPLPFAKTRMLEVKDYELDAFGYHLDTGVQDIATTLREFSKLKAMVLPATILTIKEELLRGNIIILPIAGAELKNKYFRSPPLYHTVVIVGYDDMRNVFIAHDPGTKNGAYYEYDQAALIDAVRDFSQSEGLIDKKVMVVVKY